MAFNTDMLFDPLFLGELSAANYQKHFIETLKAVGAESRGLVKVGIKVSEGSREIGSGTLPMTPLEIEGYAVRLGEMDHPTHMVYVNPRYPGYPGKLDFNVGVSKEEAYGLGRRLMELKRPSQNKVPVRS